MRAQRTGAYFSPAIQEDFRCRGMEFDATFALRGSLPRDCDALALACKGHDHCLIRVEFPGRHKLDRLLDPKNLETLSSAAVRGASEYAQAVILRRRSRVS